MSHFYAQINDVSIVIAVTESAGHIDAPHMLAIESLDADLIGKRYENGQFVNVPAPPVPPPAWEWLIDIGPFFDRFGPTKLAVLTSSDPGVKALLTDIQIRKWIDLKKQEVIDGVNYITSKVPSVTSDIKLHVLTTPVLPEENLALRKLYFNA